MEEPRSPLPLPFPIPGFPGGGGIPTGLDAAGLVGSVGMPTPRHLVYAREFLANVPSALREVGREPEGAVGLVAALLFSGRPEIRSRQLALTESGLGEEVAKTANRLAPVIEGAGPAVRLPSLDLALPALRNLDPARRMAFQSAVSALIRADGRVQPFEFALFHVLRRNLEGRSATQVHASRKKNASLSRLRGEAEAVLSALARSGARDDAEIRQAFRAGVALLFPTSWEGSAPHPAGATQLDRVDEALGRLADLRPPDLRRFLDAAVATIQADRRLTITEIEMLRAAAEALDAPIPPVVSEGKA
jgi:hypothetical protein